MFASRCILLFCLCRICNRIRVRQHSQIQRLCARKKGTLYINGYQHYTCFIFFLVNNALLDFTSLAVTFTGLAQITYERIAQYIIMLLNESTVFSTDFSFSQSCESTLRESGVIKSQGHPQAYPSYHNCRWTIQVKKNLNITSLYKFSDFS